MANAFTVHTLYTATLHICYNKPLSTSPAPCVYCTLYLLWQATFHIPPLHAFTVHCTPQLYIFAMTGHFPHPPTPCVYCTLYTATLHICYYRPLSASPAPCVYHSWAQRKLSPLCPLNILLSINDPLLSFWFNGLNDKKIQFPKIEQSSL